MNFYDGKRVLVAGATGLVGSRLVERLMKMDGVKVIALGRNEDKIHELFEKYSTNARFSCLIQDASRALPKFEEPVDFIINAIGGTSGAEIFKNPVGIIRANVSSTLNFLNFLCEQSATFAKSGRLIILSSATVYSDKAGVEKCVTEEDTECAGCLTGGNAPYSETKRFLEVLAHSYYKQYGVEYVVARPSYIYGYSHFNAGTAFYQFLENAIKGKNIEIRATSLPHRDNIYIDDLINGLLCLCQHGIPGEVYNISSNGERENFATISEVAEIIAKTANRFGSHPIKVEYPNGEVSCCGGVLLDNSKLKALGWTLKSSLSNGIEETVKAYISEFCGQKATSL